MLPASWKPVAVGPLVRVGARHDGGYVLPQAVLAASTTVLSMGLSDDWRFEEDFHARTGARILCFDGSVTRRFWVKHALQNLAHRRVGRAFKFAGYRRFFAKSKVEHRQLMIGYDGPGSVSLGTLMRELAGESIFLKCDIEGWEYRIFDQIAEHGDRFTGIAMELHDVDLHRDKITRLLEGLPQFRVAHLHANNFCPADPNGDPMVLEITLVRADLIPAGATLDTPNDAPCDPTRPDLPLTFEARALQTEPA